MSATLKKVVIVSAVVALVSLGIAAILYFNAGLYRSGSGMEGLSIDESESFSAAGISEIVVGTSSIDVLIGRSQSEEIEVRLYGTVHAGRQDTLPRLSARRSGELLSIQGERKEGRDFAFSFYSADLRLELGLPETYGRSLRVRTSSGDVEIAWQTLSELSVDTSSGDVGLNDIRASLIAMESSSGDLKGSGLEAASLEAASTSGKISIRALHGKAKARSSSGDITLSFDRLNGELEIRSSSGDVKLLLPESAQFRLEARASSGDITCQFPVTLAGAGSEISRNTLVGVIGQGIYPVAINTSSGDIDVRR